MESAAISVEVVLATTATVLLAGASFAWRLAMRELGDKADAYVEHELSDVERRLDRTERLARTAFETIHGDDDRPEDDGYVIQSTKERERLRRDVEEVKRTLGRIEQEQSLHNDHMARLFNAVVAELDIDLGAQGEADE